MAEVPEPVGAPGILVFRGSTFALKDFRISLESDGNLTSQMRPQLAWEMWPLWLRVAIEHEALAKVARGRLRDADNPEDDQLRADLIEHETRAGMVTLSATAFCMEAMARSAAAHARLPSGIGASKGAAKRIAEHLKQCFEVPPGQFADWRRALIGIFDCRNEAVHPDGGLRDPLPHPGVRASVPRPAHVFRLENASVAVEIALWTALVVTPKPRARLGKRFREQTANWCDAAEELKSLRD